MIGDLSNNCGEIDLNPPPEAPELRRIYSADPRPAGALRYHSSQSHPPYPILCVYPPELKSHDPSVTIPAAFTSHTTMPEDYEVQQMETGAGCGRRDIQTRAGESTPEQ